jgi:hypothetical protein
MGGLFLLGIFALAALAVTFVVLMAVKALLWVVLLPFRLLFYIAFGILFLPILLIKLLLGGILAVVAIPLVLIGLIAAFVGLAVPLFPLLCIAFVVWIVMRSSRSTAIART